jgi:hypothetical protein
MDPGCVGGACWTCGEVPWCSSSDMVATSSRFYVLHVAMNECGLWLDQKRVTTEA